MMTLNVRHEYSIPDDLQKQYNDKLQDIAIWMEEQLIARGITPTTLRNIRVDGMSPTPKRDNSPSKQPPQHK